VVLIKRKNMKKNYTTTTLLSALGLLSLTPVNMYATRGKNAALNLGRLLAQPVPQTPKRIFTSTASQADKLCVECQAKKLLNNSDFKNKDLSGSDLKGVNAQGTDCRGANFQWSRFKFADFRKADLTGADFEGTKLGKIVDLSKAKFGQIILPGNIKEQVVTTKAEKVVIISRIDEE
jgi:uncharacterized protein YjbI with pentapeptide repeats